ncbi:MAG: hypothetical protein IT165_17865 [Bryobacterales bacterium]|nr:hypothetical protein [Bryobacterales bacterium]
MNLRVLAAAMIMAASAAGGDGPVAVKTSFRCLWWSEQQMNGLDPDNPPEKGTEMELRKWEYSDPVGVPHPDVVDVTLEMTNIGARKAVLVETSVRWRIGPVDESRDAVWSAWAPLGKAEVGAVDFGEGRKVRVPVDLAAKMQALAPLRRWPFALEVQYNVREAGRMRLLAAGTALLPIHAGD